MHIRWCKPVWKSASRQTDRYLPTLDLTYLMYFSKCVASQFSVCCHVLKNVVLTYVKIFRKNEFHWKTLQKCFAVSFWICTIWIIKVALKLEFKLGLIRTLILDEIFLKLRDKNCSNHEINVSETLFPDHFKTMRQTLEWNNSTKVLMFFHVTGFAL